MIYVGIDVAKDKHDCCILGSHGAAPAPFFTVANSRDGWETVHELLRIAQPVAYHLV